MSVQTNRILHEDAYLLAVNKLRGELVVRGKGKVRKLPLLDFLKKDYPGLRTLHRLDYLTSGVVVFAKTKEVAEIVKDSKFRSWEKEYLALVLGRMHRRKGVIRSSLPARSGSTKLVSAQTYYQVLEEFLDVSLVAVRLSSGRRHQIRQHFADIKHPLVCDDEYGRVKFNRVFTRKFGYRDFFLHAASVAFLHPVTGKRLQIEAPLPKGFEEMVKRLRREG